MTPLQQLERELVAVLWGPARPLPPPLVDETRQQKLTRNAA